MRRFLRVVRDQGTRPFAWLAPRVGLRWRITIGFAVGACTLAVVLAAITYGLTRESLLDQREGSARDMAVGNAQTVQSRLRIDQEPLAAITGLRRPSGGGPLLFYEGEWYPGPGTPPADALPERLLRVVREQGQPARMRFGFEGETYVAVGLPLDQLDIEATYFDIVPLDDVESALESLTIGLVAAGIVTILAGAFFGWLGAKRTFRPLDSISVAATHLANGDLGTRVDAGNDPDLVPLASSFNHMVDTLRHRIEQDTRFASNVTHELRSPLTTLSASLAVLENTRDGMPDRAQTAVDLLVADVNRFTQLIEDLLEMSRLDAGVVNFEPDTVLIAELVMYAVDEQSDREIPVDVSGDLWGIVINVDKRRLLRAIANLLDNAAKYAGGADRVEMRVVGDMVQIAVEDRGPGVAPRDRHRIFDRFSRGRVEGERAKRKGVGLGLSIVAEHIRIHGGDIWVEDRPDGEQGARFVFQLPVADQQELDELDQGVDLSMPLQGDDVPNPDPGESGDVDETVAAGQTPDDAKDALDA